MVKLFTIKYLRLTDDSIIQYVNPPARSANRRVWLTIHFNYVWGDVIDRCNLPPPYKRFMFFAITIYIKLNFILNYRNTLAQKHLNVKTFWII